MKNYKSASVSITAGKYFVRFPVRALLLFGKLNSGIAKAMPLLIIYYCF